MIKKFIPLFIAIAFLLIVHQMAFDFTMTYRKVSDSFFIVGLTMFFLGIIFTTNAVDIFKGIGYTTKRLFTKQEVEKTFYEYIQNKEGKPDTIGIGVLIVGISFILISLFVGNVLG